MDEWLKGLWEKNKLFFFLLLPIILLLVFRDVILSLLVGSARKVSQDAAKQDGQLKSTLDAAALEAAKAQAEAEAAKAKINERKDSDVPEDWNTK